MWFMIPPCRPGDRSAQHEEEGAVGENWAFVAILLVIALTIPILGILAAMVLAPRRPGVIKNSTYECGVETVGETWVQFKVQFYIFALVFLVFDVELEIFIWKAVA